MNQAFRIGLLGLIVIGCGDPSNGTFVGNPGLSASYASANRVDAQGGRLLATVALFGCDPSVASPAWSGLLDFAFTENRTEDAVRVDDGEYCRADLMVREFIMDLEFNGDAYSYVATDFVVQIQSSFLVNEDGRYVVTVSYTHLTLPTTPYV